MGMLRFCCLGIGALLAGQAWADGCHLDRYGTLPVEMVGYDPTTTVKINGNDVRFIIDSGAFFSTMSNASATALKLSARRTPFGFYISGVGGDTDADVVSVKDFGILGVTLHDVDFIVGGTDTGYGLLGANVLDFADLEIDLAGGKLTFFKAEHCGKTLLAYWVKDGDEYNVADLEQAKNGRDRSTYFTVVINGKEVRALLDSGAGATVLTRSAAERAGIKLDAPGVEASGKVMGIGRKLVNSWIVRVDSFSLGTETIQHSQMQVIDGTLGDSDTDMLLGADFLLAHRMFIANSVGKAYFTYNGGRVFALATPGDGGKSDVATAADDKSATPKSANDYALLGRAHLSRGETKAAMADLDEAIRMAPERADFYFSRGKAHAALKEYDAALADLEKSLSLDPANADALLVRAEFRLWRKDREGAAADVAAANALLPPGSSHALTIAELYAKLDQPAAALPVLDEWIRLHDDDANLGNALNQRCWARTLSNQMLDDARKDCRKAIRLDGEKPAYLDSLGLVELRLGHYPDSIKAYDKALAAQPRLAWSLYGRGLAKIRSGQTDAGNADLVAAAEINPRIGEIAALYGLTAPAPAPLPAKSEPAAQ